MMYYGSLSIFLKPWIILCFLYTSEVRYLPLQPEIKIINIIFCNIYRRIRSICRNFQWQIIPPTHEVASYERAVNFNWQVCLNYRWKVTHTFKENINFSFKRSSIFLVNQQSGLEPSLAISPEIAS